MDPLHLTGGFCRWGENLESCLVGLIATLPVQASWTLYISQVSVDGESEFRIVLGWLDVTRSRSHRLFPP